MPDRKMKLNFPATYFPAPGQAGTHRPTAEACHQRPPGPKLTEQWLAEQWLAEQWLAEQWLTEKWLTEK